MRGFSAGRRRERATVKVEAASAYSHQQTSEDEIVKSFKRGDVVIVDLAFASAEGEWCAVSERDGGARLGYMRCEDLQREPAPRFISVPSQAAPSEDQKAPVRRNESPLGEFAEDYRRPIGYWAALFDFTAAQRSAVDELANSMGITACREQIAAHHRAYAGEYRSAYNLRPLPRTPRAGAEDFASDPRSQSTYACSRW